MEAAVPAAVEAAAAANERRVTDLDGGKRLLLPERTGYIIWVSDLKAARVLEKYGSVHYMSRKMHYVVMYMNAERAEETVKTIGKLPFVRKIERSYRNEIKTEYSKDNEDKTRFYSM